MAFAAVSKHAVTRMPAAIMEGMVTNQLQLTDIDMQRASTREIASFIAALVARANA